MKTCLIWLAMILSCCEAYKILVVFPMPSPSHGILGDGVVRHLLKAGHEVTYISPYQYKVPSPKLRLIDVSSNADLLPAHMMNFEAIIKKEVDFTDQTLFFPMMINMINMTYQNENVQKLLNDPKEQFDLVFVEWMFTDLLSGFAAVYNCPYVWFSSVDIHWIIMRLIDEPNNPSYTADILSVNLPPFTLWQRVTELYTQLKVRYLRYMYFFDMERQVYENIVAPIVVKLGRQPPSYYDLPFDASLVLANSHVSLGQSVSIPQSYKPVGGYHIEEDVKPLPEDLKKIMDNAKHGVIYFSMGSNLKSKLIPKVIKDELLKMFGGLKQTVLWKFEEDLPNTPKNVHILHWAPQQSILAHPNTVVFVTHGGLLSTTETVHFGVPIIGIPVFADQFINVARAVARGLAYKVDLSYTMADQLKVAIEEVTTNPKYTQKAKELSFVYHDRPVAPGTEMAHWVRHVIETRGASHLRSPALTMPFYQRLYLDLLAIVLVFLLVTVKLLKCVCCKLCTKNNVDSKTKEQKKKD